MTARGALLAVLVVGGLVFAVAWGRALLALPPPRHLRPTAFEIFVGAVTNFFDTLGIGSFATTTTLFRLGRARLGRARRGPHRTVSDRVLPGTMNVGHCLPSFVQAILAISLIEVDAVTLVGMIAAATLGAWVGAGWVARLPLRGVRVGLSIALLSAACLIVAKERHWLPSGGDALGLRGAALVIALVVNAVLGALMTLGVGMYAPCMILVSILGMNARVAFPIMMGSCALLMPVGSARFVQAKAYAPRAAVGLTLGGLPAVLVAGLLVRSLPLDAVRWLVVAVVLFTAFSMLRAALRPPVSEEPG